MNNSKASDINADSLLTSYQVGTLLQVNPSSVNKWVKDGRIPAFRTPGGHRRIRASDLVAFLYAHNMPVPQSLRHASRRRLLLVDDDQRQLESLQRLLKPYAGQLEVQTIGNGIDALVQVGICRPHLIVLDVYMPDVDGIEVCRRLKQNPDTSEVKVVMASAQLTPEVEQKAIDAGASRCISKPIEIATLLAELEVAEQSPAMMQ